MKVNVLWFKRDLRLSDHLPLKRAIEQGLPIILLYVFEPELLEAADSDVRHWRFVYESLNQLKQCLPQQVVTIVHGSADLSNWGNWAYIAGVGNDNRGVREFNIEKQTQLFDKDGAYRAQWLIP